MVSDTAKVLMVGAGVATLLALKSRTGLAGVPYQLPADQVFKIADQIRKRYYVGVSPLMLTAMAKIESAFRPGALRYETHLGDASIGLMQTLYRTARWLHDDLGYQAYQLASSDDLMDPQTSVYFGGAYVDWLSTWRGVQRAEQWVVMSYNGGPNADNSQTRNHWAKYQAAKAQLAYLGGDW